MIHLFVVLTNACNLRCTYCYGKCCDDIGGGFGFEVDYSIPDELAYDIGLLTSFCKNAKVGNLIFYGGEPLLRLDLMKKIMDEVEAERFMLQTNGLLLGRVEPEYLGRLHTILISIDGDEQLTDAYRGRGVYRRVLENAALIRERGFRGELIARMTVSTKTELESQVRHLLFEGNNTFDAVHWQLDAQFWRSDFDRDRFTEWIEDSYGPGLLHLISLWAEHVSSGRVLRIYPFLGVMESLLKGESSGLRCGSGWAQYTIQTDGTIVPCPSMVGFKDFYLGSIRYTDPSVLKHRRISLGAPCVGCDILDVCGGRCFYANITKLWGEEGFRLVCGTVRLLIDGLRCIKPIVEDALRRGTVSLEAFSYTRFNSCEIIP